MSVLIIAEHDNLNLKDSTLSCVSAAKKISKDITIFVIGSNCQDVAHHASKIDGVNKILYCDDKIYSSQLAENLSNLIVKIAKEYSHILAPASSFGKNFMPRIAALLDVAQISDAIEIIDEKTFKRPIYAGNAITTIESSDPIKLITIRQTAFNKATFTNKEVPIVTIEPQAEFKNTKLLTIEASKSDRPDLINAKIVISGGRGLGSKENFALLDKLASKLGNCAIGASRAAVDAGFVGNDYQVGQTGKIVAPELYIAIGISGAIQHLAGMKDSKIIIAINKDENAPIFEIADYGLVGDLFSIIPELIEKL